MLSLRDDSVSFDADTHKVVIVTALAACASATLVTILLLHIFSVVITPLCIRSQTGQVNGERNFLRRQLGVFLICLFFSDFVQSISGMLQIRWAAEGSVSDGPTCTVQAALLLAGDLGTCYFNAIVAIHTFVTIVLRRTIPTAAVAFLTVFGFSTIIFLSIIGPFLLYTPAKGAFYGVAGNWCFITTNYADTRLYIHYIPILVSAGIIAVLYALVFLTLRGTIRFERGALHPASSTGSSSTTEMELSAVAKKMLWYPASYVVIVLPITAARLASLRNDPVPEWVWNTGITFLFLSGFINATIYMATRRALLPVKWSPRHSRSQSSRSLSIPARGITVKREEELHYDVELKASISDAESAQETEDPPVSPQRARVVSVQFSEDGDGSVKPYRY